MICSLIYAQDLNRGIGYKGDLPWPRISVDLERFKYLTQGTTVIMGRKTYESIGRPLPNRQNIVVSSGPVEGDVLSCTSIEEALKNAQNEVFFIGGVSIYTEAVKLCERIYETQIQMMFRCDTYLPENLKEGFALYRTEEVWSGNMWLTFNEYRRTDESN